MKKMTALYVHIPYCSSKCGYCDFASIRIDDGVPAYLEALQIEVEAASRAADNVNTLYVGGGTPTILTPAQISRLFARLRELFDIAPEAEVTFEANPCSLTQEKAETLAACGVNRVSLGAQSFVDTELSFLGRAHGAGDTRDAVSLLRRVGIGNISLDLIFAIPSQTPESWRYSLDEAMRLEPSHISAYGLTFEPSTPFGRALEAGEIEKQSDEQELELYEIARDMLTHGGFEHYEISNFALPEMRSRHNLVYWMNLEYIGLGAGAVSYLGGKRISNLRDPAQYIEAMKSEGSAVFESELIEPRMQAIETMIQRLRLREGVDRAEFEARFAMHPEELFGGRFGELIDLGLLEQTPDSIRSTTRGWHLANEVALMALP
jgi:oxygen-independent coproporphyrinogen-3 oxidase